MTREDKGHSPSLGSPAPVTARSGMAAFGGGALIGTLGGLMGLGGAEFRLPMLIGAFRFAALEAVIVNKAISLLVVASALPFRTGTVPVAVVVSHWHVIANLLAGSSAGAWVGAGWAIRLRAETLYHVMAILLALIALVLLFGHDANSAARLSLQGIALILAGLAAGFGIGLTASLLGVAGGELLIPTLMLLFGTDIKLAGSLSLAVSLPTMLIGIGRYSRDRAFAVLGQNSRFLGIMAAGSVLGAYLGARLLGLIPGTILLPLLALILVLSAVRIWRHC
ncbi:sulfite exporter TauE/SafE family protein [Methylocaldum marinum]|nr:sulfite exporter TauE/SafE family protein [Methylocaldum marinum]